MPVITISREFGSGGDVISEKVAQSLGYLFIDKSDIEKVLDQYGLVTFKYVCNSDQSIWNRYDQGKTEIISMLNQTIRAFAREDNSVIVGRGGFIVLKDFCDVLHVCIHAPFERRVDNIMQDRGMNSREEAVAMVSKNDRINKIFLQTFYNHKHTEADMFSLSIDTSQIPADIACKWILEATELLDKKTIDVASSIAAIDVNSVLASTVEEVTASLRQ